MADELDELALDIAAHRCIGTLETSIHDPETGEKNYPGTRADISIEDVESIMQTIVQLQDDRVAKRAQLRAARNR